MRAPRLRWVIFIAGVTFMVAVLLTSFLREISHITDLGSTLDGKMDELVKEERKTQDLKKEIDYYNSPQGIARLAREHFNLLKSDEKMYKIEVNSGDKLQIGSADLH
jgi:cell division protein FtsB